MHNVLFVWNSPFRGIFNGGNQANYRIYNFAQQNLGGHFTSYYINDEHYRSSRYRRLISPFRVQRGLFNGLTESNIQEILALTDEYDTVFLSSSLYGKVAEQLRRTGYKGRIIIYFHNVEGDYFEAILPSKRVLRGQKVRAACYNDALSCQYADTIVTLNERDSDRLQELYGRSADVILPITLVDTFRLSDIDITLTTRQRPTCLFFGSFFPANIQGVLWFVENVLPYVDVDFRIVGKDMGRLRTKCNLPDDIEVVDSPVDLAPYILDADIVVMPIFAGSGMKVKTCEALMYGRNIIGTPESFEGYNLDMERIGACCSTAQQFVDAIRYIAENPLPRFNSVSRLAYISAFSDDTLFARLKQLFQI